MQIKHREKVIFKDKVGYIDDIHGSYVAVDFEHFYQVFNVKSFKRVDGNLVVVC